MSDGFRIIGQRQKRPDSGPKLTGRERYVADVHLPGMLHCCFVYSSHASAEILGIDPATALAVNGVVAVVTAHDLPEFARDDAPSDRGMFFLAHQRVSFVGQRVAAVLAETPAAAAIAAELVEVSYRPLPHVAGPRDARREDAPLVRAGFRHVTDLYYLRRELAELPPIPVVAGLRIDAYSEANAALFETTLLRSYHGSQDCPELDGLRSGAEIMEGHRAQGTWRPQTWWLAHRDAQGDGARDDR